MMALGVAAVLVLLLLDVFVTVWQARGGVIGARLRDADQRARRLTRERYAHTRQRRR